MFENIIVSVAVTLLAGFPLSIYAGIIVTRYFSFSMAIDNARSIILRLDQDWNYRYLTRSIDDPSSPSGTRTVFISDSISSNKVSWELMLVSLQLKELGHWRAATALDAIWMELDALRDEFLSVSTFVADKHEKNITEYIADWHRTLSKQNPNFWHIIRPWPCARYEHMSSVSVDEVTGDWNEIEPERKKDS